MHIDTHDRAAQALRRKVRDARHVAGFTIYDLAELLGWRATTVAKAERGVLNLPPMAQRVFALALYPEIAAPFAGRLARAARDGLLDMSDGASLRRGDRELIELLWTVRCLADGRAHVAITRYDDDQPFFVHFDMRPAVPRVQLSQASCTEIEAEVARLGGELTASHTNEAGRAVLGDLSDVIEMPSVAAARKIARLIVGATTPKGKEPQS